MEACHETIPNSIFVFLLISKVGLNALRPQASDQ
jgi:hypothetical protein